MNRVIKMAAAAAALSAFGTMASAVTTVNADELIIEPRVLGEDPVTAPDGSVKFDFVAGENLSISGFSFSALGASGGADINKIMVSLVGGNGGSTLLTTSGTSGNTSFGGGTLAGFSANEGDAWSILFEVADGQSLARDVSAQVVFLPEEIAPVPLPAAGGLLLAAVAAGGVVGRRKKKAD